jgi:hypothetical protein
LRPDFAATFLPGFSLVPFARTGSLVNLILSDVGDLGVQAGDLAFDSHPVLGELDAGGEFALQRCEPVFVLIECVRSFDEGTVG